MRGTGPRTKRILTMLGETTYTRSRYRCQGCKAIRYPGDEELDVADTSRSPGVRRHVARLACVGMGWVRRSTRISKSRYRVQTCEDLIRPSWRFAKHADR
jgi:hypothetical protein